MPFLAPVVPFLPAILGTLGSVFGGRKGARTGETATAGTSELATTTESTITPSTQEEFQPLQNLLISQAVGRLQQPTSLGPGFLSSGIQNINSGFDLSQQSLENRLGRAGLLGTAVHGSGLENLETRRFSDVNQFQNIDLPRFEREQTLQDSLSALALLQQQRPTITTTGGRLSAEATTGEGTQILPGSALGSGLGTAGQLLAYLYGSGTLGG